METLPANNQAITTAELDQMGRDYMTAWTEYERLKKIASEAYKKYETIEQKLLSTLQKAEKEKYEISDLGTFYTIEKLAYRVPKDIDQKKRLFDYILNKGEETFLTLLSVNYQSLNSFCNSEHATAAENNIFPFEVPGVGDPTPNVSLGFREKKNKKTK